MSQTGAAITERLKSETQDLHDAAENHGFQRALFKGQLTREEYGAYLAQMLLLHDALEKRLIDAKDACAPIEAVLEEWQLQAPYLREDLRAFGIDETSVDPLPSTRRFIERIERAAAEEPIRLLGFHYVLEGSNNGSRFIARNVRKAYDLTPGTGDRYLDPYGDEQPARWATFKQALAGVTLTDAEADSMVDAARDMFLGVAEISGDLGTPAGAI